MGLEHYGNRDGVHGSDVTGEYTLCGDALDIAETEEEFEGGSLVCIPAGKITCSRCLAVITLCAAYFVEIELVEKIDQVRENQLSAEYKRILDKKIPPE